jgi:hypothetical protein
MNKIYFLLILSTSLVFGQEKNKNRLIFNPNFTISFVTNNYFGDNYLAKGHKDPGYGFQMRSDWLYFNKFGFGFGVEKSTQKVSDFAIGGNIQKTNSNSIFCFLTYNFNINQKLSLNPEVNFGGIELRQKSGGKFYGQQNGQRFGSGLNINYKINKTFSIFSNVGYSIYRLKTNTSDEFINYFNRANSINFSIGIKLK